MAYRPPYIDERAITIEGPHPATLEDSVLLAQCEIETGRVDTAVWIKHVPTEVETHATERRSQAQNRHVAIFRLRVKLACKVRTITGRDTHKPSVLWQRRRQGEKLPVNPENRDFPALLAEALDVITARRFDVAGAAGLLGVTMSQLTRLIRHERHAFALVNDGREAVGLAKLRS
jgi:hypothetical protein